ncbi:MULTISPECIES: hypothetical protein [unclassified Devosia]|uniref:hypothetical protein n=1 Tax=unclassified Devosia TaxID=196773 RepID=UPI001553105B|nr:MULTISPECIES: hypothetical protein [unclassified Devosia]
MFPFLPKLVSLWPLVAASVQQPILLPDDGAFHPAPNAVASFLGEQFEAVPAPTIADKVAVTTCRLELMEEQAGFQFKGAYFCWVDFGCSKVEMVPVWFDQHQMWFGPDSAGRLVAMFCAESISDPERRKALSQDVQRGG